MKKITAHKVNGLNEAIEIEAGEPGQGGAPEQYRIALTQAGSLNPLVFLQFQSGPIKIPANFNGLTNEALLAVLIDRMQGFQSGPFACRENAIALTKMEEALMWLQKRTRDRMTRGVEGTLLP